MIPVTWGNYVRITAGDTAKIIVANPQQTEYILQIKRDLPLRTGADYYSVYDRDAGLIRIYYEDIRFKTHRVEFTITRAADNVVIFNEVYTSFPISDAVPVNWTNTSYRVSMRASGSPEFTNTWTQWVGTDGVKPLPGDIAPASLTGLWLIVLLFVGGLFSYLSGPHGAVIVALLAGFLSLIGWLPLNPALIAIAIVWAFLGLLGRTSGE